MSVEVIEATEVFKTTWALEINKLMDRITLFWCFGKKYFWTEWWNFKWNSAIIQVWGCGGGGCYFQSNQRVISQMSASHKCTDFIFVTQKCIFDGLISVYFHAYPVWTPCMKQITLYFVFLLNTYAKFVEIFLKTMRKNAEGTTLYRCDPSKFAVHFVTKTDFRISSIKESK